MSDTTNIFSTSVISDTSIDGELIYGTAAVSKVLGVHERTLRKYCALMGKHNYEFNKNAMGHRAFYKKDIEVIKKIVDLKNLGSLTLNESVKTILESDIDNIDTISAVEPISNPDYNKLLGEFTTFKNEQQQFNQQLVGLIQKQQNYIKYSIEQRDRKLMFAIKESMEMRRQLAAAEEKKENEKKKKKSWWQFWK
ncbi:DUF3967 domain-containing protein [Rummeliibacillus pycnus]|uniref:DUF3967 domain-containing protein n=1 Tax=Rummeliibacillus pycnus TaxID=101070 RepID=UPI003D2CD29C